MDYIEPIKWIGAFVLSCFVLYTFSKIIGFGLTMGHWKAKIRIKKIIEKES